MIFKMELKFKSGEQLVSQSPMHPKDYEFLISKPQIRKIYQRTKIAIIKIDKIVEN